ncbi:hypothetical protein [Bernardetia sp.]|uniref:hypothetical protein n=1 Tax=Bernardetia sp. TaxID=1937974 RepID=UPI0025C4EFE9|nr:hypothetical protein [Bernardetia sp.]
MLVYFGIIIFIYWLFFVSWKEKKKDFQGKVTYFNSFKKEVIDDKTEEKEENTQSNNNEKE